MSQSLKWVKVTLVLLALSLPGCGGGAEQPRLPAAEETPQGTRSEEPGRPPALVDLEGTWSQDGTDHIVVFRLDGTYEAGADVSEFARDRAGTFEMEGSKITFTNTGKGTRCEPGTRWVWERVEVMGPGRLRAFIGRDTCSTFYGVETTWTRVSR